MIILSNVLLILAALGVLIRVIYIVVQIVKDIREARTKKIVNKTMQKIQDNKD